MANFNDAATALLLQQPFFGSLLMRFKHIEDATLNPPTMCVSASTIRYHPEFVAKCSDDECVFVIAHEVMHAVWQHLPRIKHYIEAGVGPDGHALCVRTFNQAADFPINDSLRESKVGKVPDWFPLCLDRKYPYTMTPEEVYCDLRKQAQQKKGKSKPGKGEAGQGEPGNGEPDAFDGHDHASEDVDGPGAITTADVIQAANLARATQGKLPAGVDRLVGDILKPDVSPWKKLRRAVVTSLSGYDQQSWRRLQRRMIVRGIGMPGRVAAGGGKVGIVVDTSGSIDAHMLRVFGGHMAAILQDARPECAMVYWVDAKVHRVDKIKTGTDLRLLLAKPVPGGGGTDMPEGVDQAIADGCDCVVVLTDGFTPFGSRSPKQVVWAITTPGKKAPHGETIHIAESR